MYREWGGETGSTGSETDFWKAQGHLREHRERGREV